MSSSFKINSPCPKSWDSMKDISEGKFCEFCEKSVWDLTKKKDFEILEIAKSNPNLCGKLSISKFNFAITLVLTASCTLVSCSVSKNFENRDKQQTEQIQTVVFKGNLKLEDSSKLKEASVKFVTLKKIFSSDTNDPGDFVIKIPLSILKEKNIIVIDYTFLYGENFKIGTRSQNFIVKRNDILINRSLTVNNATSYIGAVVITSPSPPDFYYLDGNNITERKFKDLKKNNPTYRELVFDEDYFTEILTKKSFVGSVYLLYSD